MPHRSQQWVWAGRVVFGVLVAGVVVYLVVVGLDKADKTASSIGAVVALVALAVPYLLPPRQSGGVSMPDADRVEESGKAIAKAGGRANTGADTDARDRSAQVVRSGDATAEGPGSVANTGIQRGSQ